MRGDPPLYFMIIIATLLSLTIVVLANVSIVVTSSYWWLVFIGTYVMSSLTFICEAVWSFPKVRDGRNKEGVFILERLH